MGKLFILFPIPNYKRENVNKERKEISERRETKHLHLKAFYFPRRKKFQFSVVTIQLLIILVVLRCS